MCKKGGYLCAQNDEAGKRAINMLTNQLNKAKVTNYVVQIARKSKDANEALVTNREQFTKDIESNSLRTLREPLKTLTIVYKGY